MDEWGLFTLYLRNKVWKRITGSLYGFHGVMPNSSYNFWLEKTSKDNPSSTWNSYSEMSGRSLRMWGQINMAAHSFEEVNTHHSLSQSVGWIVANKSQTLFCFHFRVKCTITVWPAACPPSSLKPSVTSRWPKTESLTLSPPLTQQVPDSSKCKPSQETNPDVINKIEKQKKRSFIFNPWNSLQWHLRVWKTLCLEISDDNRTHPAANYLIKHHHIHLRRLFYFLCLAF